MSEIISVTNRALCRGDFFARLGEISDYADRIILREKDIPEEEYFEIAERALAVCGEKLYIHNFPKTAERLGVKRLHLPLHILRGISESDRKKYSELGTSCHSREDALEAERLGCTYIFAGHIFETDCKKGLAGRGLGFLKTVCESVSIPVYAIGGISAENIASVIEAGADGACIMSGLMTCGDAGAYINDLKGSIR